MEITGFDTFHFYPCITTGIQALGYTVPTPVQSEVIPLIMQGKDVIGLSADRTEKTAAFVLPILHRLWPGGRGCTRALILTPTPKLAEETGAFISRSAISTGLQNTVIQDGFSTVKQIKALRSADIVTGCPGHILDYLWKGFVNLSNLEILVIDEADRMSGLDLLPDIFNILMCVTTKRQTALFSTSIPDNLRRLSRQFMKDPVTVQIYARAPVKATSKPPDKAVPNTPPPVIKNYNKTALLKRILSKTVYGSVLVFTRTDDSTAKVAEQVIRAGYQVTALQGNLSQYQQQAKLKGFAAGSIKILVVNDNRSRGIDVSSIFRLINDDKPGKTGNEKGNPGRAGKVDKNGDALTLVTNADTMIIHSLEQFLDTPLESLTIQDL